MNIEAKELSKIYGSGESRVVALDKVNLEIASSDFISIMGPSGSGKSTLLHLLSGLDKPTSGSLTYDGKDIYGDTTVQQTDLTVGDTIQLGDRTLPVLGLTDTAITINNDGFTNGVQLIVNDEIYCSLLGNDSYSEVYPTLQDNADTDTFESWLDSWCSNYPGTHWLSYLQSSNEMIESFEQIKMLCWVLIIFIGIIGILNIINTVYSNIHTRVGEIGMQRAIGMSAASLYKTFLWEGAYYGIIASVIGAVFGYVCCIFVGAAQTDALQLVAVPVMAIVEAAIISIVACLLATAIPLRSIARMSIVDSIETVE